MIAYYVHWNYPTTADNANFYAGQDDDKLFHHKENAEAYAKKELASFEMKLGDFLYLDIKSEQEGLSEEEENMYDELSNYYYSDIPNSYTIRERDIKFEDEL